MVAPGYRKRTIFLLLALLLVRFWFGQTFELTGTEALIWLEGHGNNLDISYWDRGPLLPWLVRLGTIFFGDTELGVRWLAAVITCSTGFILFYLARRWFNARAAFWTVILFILTPLYAWKLSFMTDGTASVGLMALTLLAARGALEEDRTHWWFAFGVINGLALLIAFPNGWWLVGFILYFGVTERRRGRLREALLWSSIVVAALFLVPVLMWWNRPEVADVLHAHIWNSTPLGHPFSFHKGVHFIWLTIFYLSPFLTLTILFIFVRLGRQLILQPHDALLFWLPVPGLIWQLFSAFFQEIRFDLLPALFLPWLLLTGCTLARLTRIFPVVHKLALGIFFLLALQSLAGLNPFYALNSKWQLQPLSAGQNAASLGYNDLQVSWPRLADQVERLQHQEGAVLIMTNDTRVASALSFYLPLHPLVYVVSTKKNLTPFDFWPNYWEVMSASDSALYLTSGNTTVDADLLHDFDHTNWLTDIDPLPDSPLHWNYLSCQKFIPNNHAPPASDASQRVAPDAEPLPK